MREALAGPMHVAPDVSILIVAYNSQAVIESCLTSIPPACARFDYEVLLLDNGDGATAHFRL
mgnify:CR=1 FL=1